MNDDDHYWLAFWSIISTALTILVLGGCAMMLRHDEKMAELGYEETMLTGSNYAHWCKIRPVVEGAKR